MSAHGEGPQRPDEDDQDLLTYGEVAVRLADEIRAEAERLDGWLAREGAGEDVGSQRERSQVRLEQLREAAERNAPRQLSGDRFEAFFGYRPPEGR